MTDLGIGIVRTDILNDLKPISTPVDKTVTKEKSKKDTIAKVALGGLVATAAIATALLAIKKGTGLKTVKETGIDAFKEAGNTFQKGKAVTKEGKPFSGVITKMTKNGQEKRTMFYENGVLKEVKVAEKTPNLGNMPEGADNVTRNIYAKLRKNNEYVDVPLKGKKYIYNENGQLQGIEKKVPVMDAPYDTQITYFNKK